MTELHQRVGRSILRGVVLAVLGTFMVTLASAPQAIAAPPLSAPRPEISATFASGRATIWLSNAETRALGSWIIPRPPAWLPGYLQVGYFALAATHVLIAQQYANRGWCSGFRLSIYPWETQGYFGYRC